MGKRGPKPKPTAIRVLEGNPSNAPFNEREPKPLKIKTLEYVDWMLPGCEYMIADTFPLGDVTRLVWDKMAPELVRLGVLTEVDREMFARYCETFARWLKMKAFIDKNGEAHPVYDYIGEKNDEGKKVVRKTLKKMQPFPHVDIYKALAYELRRYEGEFGIGAASRTKIQTIVQSALTGGPTEEVSDFDYASYNGLRAIK